MFRVGTIDLSILPELVSGSEPFTNTKGKTHLRKVKKYMLINGFNVKLSSDRYVVFKNSLSCVNCGIIGSYFAVEKNNDDFNYHLNLYAINENGEEVLMTKDHINPKSNGGKNRIGNYQTMCYKCNYEKGNKHEND